jgi:hypothetical protein
MRVHDFDAFESLDLRQIQAECFERAFEFALGAIGDFRPRLGAAHMQIASIALLRTPAVNFHFDLLSEFTAQIVHVDTRAAIHLRWILTRE